MVFLCLLPLFQNMEEKNFEWSVTLSVVTKGNGA